MVDWAQRGVRSVVLRGLVFEIVQDWVLQGADDRFWILREWALLLGNWRERMVDTLKGGLSNG